MAFLTESCTSCTLKCFFSIYLFFYLEICLSIKLVIDAVTCSHCLDILFLRFKIKKVEFNVMNRVLFSSFFKLVKWILTVFSKFIHLFIFSTVSAENVNTYDLINLCFWTQSEHKFFLPLTSETTDWVVHIRLHVQWLVQLWDAEFTTKTNENSVTKRNEAQELLYRVVIILYINC